MKLSKEQAWKIHRESALKLIGASLALDLARISFAVNQKENRQLDTDAKNSTSTARGLMQMLKGTQCEIASKFLHEPCNLSDIFDPVVAVKYAQVYLLYQFRRYASNWHKAVHAYNQGSYSPSRKRAFASGESYANSALSFYNSVDFAALDSSIGFSRAAALAQSGTYSGWS